MNEENTLSLESAARACQERLHPIEFSFPWERVPEVYRREMIAQAEELARVPYPLRRATEFLAYVRNGSRRADEDPYFLRRRKLCCAAVACGLGEKQYLDDVVDGIWCICEETIWVISAHNVNAIPGAPKASEYPLPDPEKPYIDLFAAQTGMILALVRRMLGPKLDEVSPMLGVRISGEIRRRILDPFMNQDEFWWMGFLRKDLCNWTPWIVSNVMCCAMAEPMAEGELGRLLVRACGMLDRWLAVVPADGGCDEGAGYWNMAGGALLDCLEMLEEASEGEMCFWGEEKIRNILSFPARAEIGEGYFLNFADCDAQPFLSGERIQTAGEKLKDPVLLSLGCRLRKEGMRELSDVPHFSRLLKLLFHPAAEVRDIEKEQDIWFPDLQVRVAHRGGWTFAAKGGHNGESHNHNDVGSFMLYLNDGPEIVDAGNMVYTAQTFSDRRYELWNTRSAYHNLPLFGGKEQLAGAEYRARDVEFLPDGIQMELAAAYDPAAGVTHFLRRMELSADELRIRDQVELKDAIEGTWVFLFRNPPVRTAAGLETERIRLKIPAGWRTEIEKIPVTDARMAKNWPGSLWRACVTDGTTAHYDVEWRFQRRR